MSQENPVAVSDASDLGEATAISVDACETGQSIARRLDRPLTSFLLYIEELKQHVHQTTRGPAAREDLQKLVEEALQETARVNALVKHIGGTAAASVTAPATREKRQRRRKLV